MPEKPLFDYPLRRERLLQLAFKQGAGAVLVTNETNVRYLSGFSGDSSYLLLSSSRQWIISDSRYDTQIANECADLELVTRTAAQDMKSLVGETLRQLSGSGDAGVAIEADSLSKAEYDGLVKEVPEIQFIDTVGLVLGLRAIKDSVEIQLIRRSIEIAQAAFLQLCRELRADWTELQAAHRLEQLIRDRGGQGRAFDTIIAGGPRAALPHAGATEHTVGSVDSLLIDWGAKANGYCSDLTRVLTTAPPSPTLIRIHQVVVEAQEKAIAAIRPGVDLQAVDLIAREHIAANGFGDFFGHGLGHGFGLQIHESPRLSPLAKGVLEAGMIVTVEPGIYLPNDCGVRMEDDVLVTEDGCEVLSNLPRSLRDNHVNLG